jgi:hypothetical protein
MLKIKTSDIAAGAAMPMKKSVLNWLQLNTLLNDGYTIQTLLNGVTSNYYICYGLDETVSGSTHTFTDGVIYYGSGFYFVTGATVILSVGQVVVLTINETFPLVGTEDPTIFSNGIGHNIHEADIMVLSGATSGSGTVNFTDLKRINDKWHTLNDTGEPTLLAGWSLCSGSTSEATGLSFKKDVTGKRIDFKGGVSKTAVATADIFTLPPAYRPTTNRTFLVLKADDSGYNSCQVKITASTGVVNVSPTSPSGFGIISFTGASFYID